MPVAVATQPNSLTAVTFDFVVPGHQRWTLRSVRADATRAVGGVPNRAYRLDITDGTTTVTMSGASDAGTEPGTCSITWTDTLPSATAAGADGIVTAPLVAVRLEAGYHLIGTILHPAAGDAWVDAVVWFDYTLTTPPGSR